MNSIVRRVRPVRGLGARIRGRVRTAVIETMPNLVLNRILNLRSIPFDQLRELPDIELSTLDMPLNQYSDFLTLIYPNWSSVFADAFYKKLLEFYISYTLLDIQNTDVYLDAAGGCYTYVTTVKSARRILQDRSVNSSLKREIEAQGVEIVESSADSIALPDGSIDKISCHHSFEHFRGNADIRFIQELQRLLKPKGKACIVPIFISDKYYEITDSLRSSISDPLAKQVYDPTSPFPGGEFSGRLARVYDTNAVVARVLRHIDPEKFRISIHELRLNGTPLPNPSLKCHRTDPRVDFPYRALLLERRG